MEKDNTQTLITEGNKKYLELSRIVRFIVSVDLIIISIILSGDSGVIASSKNELQTSLNFNDKEFGIFSGITSTGRITGTFVFMALLVFDFRKLLTITCLFLCIIFFSSFMIIENKFLLFIIRFMLGFSRSYFQVYTSVYHDQFGIKKLKTFLISIGNITSPLGRTLGFSIGTFNGPNNWQKSFFIVSILLLAVTILLIFIPSIYFSGKAAFYGYKNSENILVKDSINRKGDSIFEMGEVKMKKKEIIWSEFFAILKNKTFLFTTLTKTNLYFVLDISHLFIRDYVNNGLKFNDTKQILYYYGLASVIGPSLGGFIGGSIITKVGGYENKNSCCYLQLFSFLALLVAIWVIFVNNVYYFFLSLFLFYVTVYMFYPIFTGYTISSLSVKQKGTGYSFSILFCTFLGNLPGPLFYGALNDAYKNVLPKLAWGCSIGLYSIGFIFSQIACRYRYKDLEKIEEENKKNNGEELKNLDNEKK